MMLSSVFIDEFEVSRSTGENTVFCHVGKRYPALILKDSDLLSKLFGRQHSQSPDFTHHPLHQHLVEHRSSCYLRLKDTLLIPKEIQISSSADMHIIYSKGTDEQYTSMTQKSKKRTCTIHLIYTHTIHVACMSCSKLLRQKGLPVRQVWRRQESCRCLSVQTHRCLWACSHHVQSAGPAVCSPGWLGWPLLALWGGQSSDLLLILFMLGCSNKNHFSAFPLIFLHNKVKAIFIPITQVFGDFTLLGTFNVSELFF